MMFSASLLITLLLALSIVASLVEVRNSPVTLPIVGRLNISNGTMNILQHDQARVAARKGRSASLLDRRDAGIATTMLNVGIAYVAMIGIGSPSNNCKFNLEQKIAIANG